MYFDLDLGGVNVFVSVSEVTSYDGSEEFWRRHRMLLGQNVHSLLHGVCRDDDAVISFGVATKVNWQSILSVVVLSTTYEVSISP